MRDKLLYSCLSFSIRRNVMARKSTTRTIKSQKIEYKEKMCNVINYNSKEKYIDVMFDGYGIRIKNINSFDGELAKVKYTGEIGKPNFTCTISMV